MKNAKFFFLYGFFLWNKRRRIIPQNCILSLAFAVVQYIYFHIKASHVQCNQNASLNHSRLDFHLWEHSTETETQQQRRRIEKKNVNKILLELWPWHWNESENFNSFFFFVVLCPPALFTTSAITQMSTLNHIVKMYFSSSSNLLAFEFHQERVSESELHNLSAFLATCWLNWNILKEKSSSHMHNYDARSV